MKKFRMLIFMMFAMGSVHMNAQAQYSAIAGASPHLVKTGRYGTQATQSSKPASIEQASHPTVTRIDDDSASTAKGTQKVKNGVKEIGEGIGQAASSGWKNANNSASKTWKKVRKGATQSWKNAGDDARKVGKGAGTFFHKLGKGISDAFKKDSTDTGK